MSFFSGIFGPPDCRSMGLNQDFMGLIKVSKHKDPRVRKDALYWLTRACRVRDANRQETPYLMKIGSPAIFPVVERLNDPMPMVRKEAIKSIMGLRDYEDDYLDGTYGEITFHNGKTGRKVPWNEQKNFEDLIIERLQDPDESVRIEAAESLKRFGKYPDKLMNCLYNSKDEFVRFSCMDAILANCHDGKSWGSKINRREIENYLNDPNTKIREGAQKILDRLEEKK
jgi:hypothetical protein